MINRIIEDIKDSEIGTEELTTLIDSITRIKNDIENKEARKKEVLNDVASSITDACFEHEKAHETISIIEKELFKKDGWLIHFLGNGELRIWHPEKSKELEENKYYDLCINCYSYDVTKCTTSKEDFEKISGLIGGFIKYPEEE
ncbi:hypothetical protein OZZ08_10105 [Malaciobacter mytili]|uniref:hypothetical protein n=1 Tax=Malaciobacter mytili TaxID=603050 RepID=UPI003BB18F0F